MIDGDSAHPPPPEQQMLQTITLQFGSSQGEPPLTFDPGTMTVFVGPNNSGKSLILREIETSVTSTGEFTGQIIKPLTLAPLAGDKVKPLFRTQRGLPEDAVTIRDPITGRNISTNLSSFISTLEELLGQQRFDKVRNMLAPVYGAQAIRLDGQTRLSLLQDQSQGDLLATPTNLFQALFENDNARKRLRRLTYEAFGLYCTLDPTAMNVFRMRMSTSEPVNEEKSLTGESLSFFSAAKPISEFSDGVKAYTGLAAVVLTTPYLLMLIDEPEAFLHPPLIRRLGRVLTELARERDGHVVASTHSSEFLMGCVQSRQAVNVVRLTYKQGKGSARLLSASKLQTMMRDPFLRSTGVLNALFHDGAIVSEADMDRAFYQEINERLLEARVGGVENTLFLNANGKDSIARIVQPLREMGIPAAIIVDLDILVSGFMPLLQSAFIPPPLLTSLNTLKDQIKRAFDHLGASPKKVGIQALGKVDQESAGALLNSLSEYGVFVVPTGEVERWLPTLNLTGHGPYWLAQAFESMGSDPSDGSYLRPQDNDVWRFIRDIAAWITDPDRKGIPS
jgi:ABC-type polar amino acid transport system ATPase subunit